MRVRSGRAAGCGEQGDVEQLCRLDEALVSWAGSSGLPFTVSHFRLKCLAL